jgi:hypothetical protein
MAKQDGFGSVKGTIGSLTYYSSRDGDLVRKKGGVNGDRIASGETFIRARETNLEFAAAGKAGKAIRASLSEVMKGCSDGKVTSRLVKQLMQITKMDPINGRGRRNVVSGPIHLLSGFEFNANSPLDTTLKVQPSIIVNRTTGEMTVRFASFSPEALLSFPQEATHFRIFAAAAEVEPISGIYKTSIKQTEDFSLERVTTGDISLVNTVTPESSSLVIVAAGIRFFQKIANGTLYQLNNRAFNALKILDASKEVA